MDSLKVYLNDIQVARLTDVDGAMSLTYDPDYATDSQNEPLSHTLPLGTDNSILW